MTLALIADDSPIFAEMLAEVLAEERDITVAGVASDGARAVALVRTLRPDVVVMDVVMPVLDGFEAVSKIMAEHPTPVLMMTGDARGRTGELGFEALRRGAVDLVLKPSGWPFTQDQRRMLRERVRAAARMRPVADTRTPAPMPALAPPAPGVGIAVVGIGGSTGGPSALATILRTLPADFPAGIAIVQHVSAGFVDALARWLAPLCRLRVTVARDRDACRPGVVLLAPDDVHLTIDREARVRLTAAPERVPHRPSVDVLFESLAASFGPRAVGVVLTGMGDDGARGLAAMRRAGAFTFAQDEASSVVFGMPKAALLAGGTQQLVPLDKIAATLCGPPCYPARRAST